MNRARIPAILLMILALFGAGTACADAGMDAFKQAIRAKYDMKEQAFAESDADAIVDGFYSADVISTDNEGHTHVGREELRPLYEEVTAGHNVRIESVYTHLNDAGDTGWDWANFYVTPKDPDSGEEPFSFKILFLWEKENGEWWCQGDMYVLGEFRDHVAE